jgi:gamma-glutamyltranspeptidase/glutathione hydrolase
VKKLQNGVEIMKKGGNAFDAMVARTGISSSLPYAGNLGGGGFMVYRKQMEKGTLDYRERRWRLQKICF